MDAEKAAECTACYRRLFFEVNDRIGVKMFPGVADTLRRMHKSGMILTIATSRGRQSVIDFIRSFRLDDIITYIIAAEDVTHTPSPMPNPSSRHSATLISSPKTPSSSATPTSTYSWDATPDAPPSA